MHSVRAIGVTFGAVVLLATPAGAQITAPGSVTGMVLQYQAFFTQSSTSPPPASTQHACSAFMTLSSALDGTIDYIDVESPDFNSYSTSGSGTFYSTSLYNYASQAALMAAWPGGNYTFSVTDYDENVTNFVLSQPSTSGAWPTSVPAFTPASYNALQGMDPTQPLTVSVNSFVPVPPTNGQLSGISINRRFGTLQGPTAWSSLTTIGSPTSSRTIPANALLPDTDYFATWTFDQRFSNSYPPPAIVTFTNVTFGYQTRVAFHTGTGAPPACAADLDNGSGTGTPDGGVDINDLLFFLGAFEAGNTNADLDNGSGDGIPDGGVDINDLLFFLAHFEAGC